MGRERISRGVSIAFAAALFAVLVILLAGATRGTAKPPPTGTGNGGVALKRIGNFDQPVYTATAPGKANRKLIFVVERGGAVRVIRNGKTLDKPFLDISSRLKIDFAERGLLSIAFDPGYAKNRRFYVYYTAAPDGDVTVAQYRRARNSKVVADPGSAREVISIPHPSFPNHNGGEVTFGPDGNMWLATGDGGAGAIRRRTPRTPTRCSASCCGSPEGERRLHGSADNPFVRAGRARTRSTPTGSATPSGSPSTRQEVGRDRRRRPERLGGDQLPEDREGLPAPTSAGTPTRASARSCCRPTAGATPAPRSPPARPSRSSSTRTRARSRSVHGLCGDRRAGGPGQASEEPSSAATSTRTRATAGCRASSPTPEGRPGTSRSASASSRRARSSRDASTASTRPTWRGPSTESSRTRDRHRRRGGPAADPTASSARFTDRRRPGLLPGQASR